LKLKKLPIFLCEKQARAFDSLPVHAKHWLALSQQQQLSCRKLTRALSFIIDMTPTILGPCLEVCRYSRLQHIRVIFGPCTHHPVCSLGRLRPPFRLLATGQTLGNSRRHVPLAWLPQDLVYLCIFRPARVDPCSTCAVINKLIIEGVFSVPFFSAFTSLVRFLEEGKGRMGWHLHLFILSRMTP
jgi:hypothetical protein